MGDYRLYIYIPQQKKVQGRRRINAPVSLRLLCAAWCGVLVADEGDDGRGTWGHTRHTHTSHTHLSVVSAVCVSLSGSSLLA